ncbi:AraC family transcriptional regulator [Agaribacterium sp. ZY112]|uniref:AraC family transcriptional regulator n=1 Tax=Agaribacterium sp. ZY112 TaxID=3233574 RepID=UPI0035260DC5
MHKKHFKLQNHHVLQTHDFDQAAQALENTWRPHQGLQRIGRNGFNFDISVASTNQLLIGQGTLKGLEIKGGRLEDYFTLAIPLSGFFRFTMENNAHVISKGKASVYSAGHEHDIWIPEHCELFNVRFPKAQLQAELEKLLGRKLSQDLRFEVELNLNCDFGQSLLRLLSLIVDDVNRQGLLSKPRSLAAHHLELSLLTLLLEEQTHNYSAELKQPQPQAGAWQVQRAEAYACMHLQQAISAGDLAKAAGVSERSLSTSFQKVHACSPTQFVRNLKLDAIRKDLMHKSKQNMDYASITDLALKYGFQHMGHFSQHYKQRFHETPSNTLKKAKDIF